MRRRACRLWAWHSTRLGAEKIRSAEGREKLAARAGSLARRLENQGTVAAFSGSGTAPAGVNTSTANVNLRCSPDGMAPTPTTCRVSSPRSFVIVTTTTYSHASPILGCRIAPSTRRGEKVGTTASPLAPGANRTCLRHEGQTLVLCRITARQCGQVRVDPAGVRRVLTRPGESPS